MIFPSMQAVLQSTGANTRDYKSSCLGRRFFIAVTCAIFLLLALYSASPRAQTVSITLAELDSLLMEAQQDRDSLRRAVLGALARDLQESALSFASGELVFHDLTENLLVDGGCNRTLIRSLETTLTLSGDSGLQLQLESLYEPLRLTLDLHAILEARGNAKQTYGVDIGGCRTVGTDNLSINAFGPVALQVELGISFNPVWVAPSVLRLSPGVTLAGLVPTASISVDVDDTIVASIVEDLLQDRISDELGTQGITARFAELQASLQDRIVQTWPDGYVDIVLPVPDEGQTAALYTLLSDNARFPLLLDYVQQHRAELLGALLLGDSQSVETLLESAALCETSATVMVEAGPASLYTRQGGSCVSASPRASGYPGDSVAMTEMANAVSLPIDETRWFADVGCRLPVSLRNMTMQQWCENTLERQRLGNGSLLGDAVNSWSLSPSTRLDIGVLSLENTRQPYLRQLVYRTVQTTRGECSLEMRIHTPHPRGDQVLKPLIALHGGSWQNRGSAFLGMEATLAHFTDAGFVVFAPFYRLLGDKDGNSACNDTSFDELLSDVQSAFTWVRNNSAYYGAAGQPVLFGQSAGGQLAARLAVDYADEVAGAILLYAPTDFGDLLNRLRDGTFSSAAAERVVEVLAGTALQEIATDSDLIYQNTLPAIIAAQPDAFPPMYLVHGEADALVPFSQSSRLCNALAGDLYAGPVPYDDGNPEAVLLTDDVLESPLNPEALYRRFDCDSRGSQLHLLSEGQHALDLCVVEGLCRAGSAQSAELAGRVMQGAVDWAVWLQPAGPVASGDTRSQPTIGNRGGGAGSGGPLLILGLLGCWLLFQSRSRSRYWRCNRKGLCAAGRVFAADTAKHFQ